MGTMNLGLDVVHGCFCNGRLAIMGCLKVKSSSFLGMQVTFREHGTACYLRESGQITLKF